MVEVWMNRSSGDLVLATPWWEPLTIDYDEKLFNELLPLDLTKAIEGRKIAKGLVVQVGWMIQNRNDVWMGLNQDAKDFFEVIGEA